jgi:hypothetical protein
MKKPAKKNFVFRILAALFVSFSGWVAYSAQSGVIEIYKNATAPFDDKKSFDSVLPLTDNTVAVRERYQGGRFRTETRKDKIERFTCSKCHNNKNVTIVRAAEMAHGDITLVHGGRTKPLSCFTCHSKEERDYLVTEAGIKVDMDHSYQMCGQCHFRQKKDWVGGAHGKRVYYWAGERVVKNCASCHDPHSPLFKKRWPKTYSPPFKK